MTELAYRRVIVKLSGEALSGESDFGVDQAVIDRLADDLIASQHLGIAIGVVVGGGNMFRGVEMSTRGVSRATGDAMGMLATVMNAIALEAVIERKGCEARTLSAIAMPQICESFNRQRALKHLAKGRIVVLAGGTGNPLFTTDTTAVLRAAELNCDAVLKATNVDGVYSADPRHDKTAKRYDRLTPQEAIQKDLKVMDATAFALARENRMPIIVFSIGGQGAIEAVLRGKGRATLVSDQPDCGPRHRP